MTNKGMKTGTKELNLCSIHLYCFDYRAKTEQIEQGIFRASEFEQKSFRAISSSSICRARFFRAISSSSFVERSNFRASRAKFRANCRSVSALIEIKHF